MAKQAKSPVAAARRTKRPAPEWVELDEAELSELIIGMGKKGTAPAAIGQVLRDQHGIPNVKSLTGKSVTEFLVAGGVKIEYPADLLALIERAVRVRRHLKANTADTHNGRQLNNIESRIRRLARYYEREGKIPAGWRYDPEMAALLVK